QVMRAAVAQCNLAGAFGAAVGADGMSGVGLAIWPGCSAIEHVVGGVMHHACAALLRPGADYAGRIAIDALREFGLVFRAIDRGVGGSVDDDVRRNAIQRSGQAIEIREVDRFATRAIFERAAAGGRNYFVFRGRTCKRAQQFAAHLAVRAGYQDAHRHLPVIPAKAGIQPSRQGSNWIPAYAGMTSKSSKPATE